MYTYRYFISKFQNLLGYYDPAPILLRPLPNHIKPHTYGRTGVRMYIHKAYVQEHTHSRIHICMLSIIHINAYIDMYIHAYVYTYIHTYGNTFMHANVHTYIHTIGLKARWQTDWAIEDQAKTWTQQPVPMISEHSAHSTPLPLGFRIWLWRYTCVLLLISMLWHGQAIFESKGDKLSSSVKCSVRNRVSATESLADWMSADKPTELSRIKLKLELNIPHLWSASIRPTRPHFQLAFAPGSGDIRVRFCTYMLKCLQIFNY